MGFDPAANARCYLWLVILGAVLLGLGACGSSGPGPEGGGNTKTAYEQEPDKDLPPDDALDAKNPAYAEHMVGRRELGYSDAYINGSDAVIGLNIIEAGSETEKERLDTLYPTMSALAAGFYSPHALLPSIDLLDRFTKTTDDAVYGAIELAYHDGDAVNVGGKQALLSDILAALLAQPASAGRDLAAGFVAAAIRLGGGEADAGPGAAQATAIETAFLADPIKSKPLGFYDEDETLRLVFKRDRLLQQSFGWPRPITVAGASPDEELAAMACIARVLIDDPELLEAYGKYQRTAERLTNPTSNLDLRDVLPFEEHFGSPAALRAALEASPAWQTKVLDRNASNDTNAGVAFWPFSYSKEGVLMSNVPPDAIASTNMMDLFTEAIRSGEIDLAPLADSGWYDYQVFALETFLLPDRASEYQNLLLSGLYKQRLKNAFEALITQRRETHIKQLEIGCTIECEPPPPPTPLLRVEPVVTHYLRTARGYAMLLGALDEVLGAEPFGGIILADGTTVAREELEQACTVFYGLQLLSCCDIGLPSPLEPDELGALPSLDPVEVTEELLLDYPVAADPAIAADEAGRRIAACQLAEQWLAELWDGEFLAADPRVIVPVFFDPNSGNLRCWAVLGVKALKLEAYYAREPRVIGARGPDGGELSYEQAVAQLAAGQNQISVNWESLKRFIPTYEFAEVEIGSAPLTREEFRTICDGCTTREEIIDALSALAN